MSCYCASQDVKLRILPKSKRFFMESNPYLKSKKWSLTTWHVDQGIFLTKYRTGDVMNFGEPNFLIPELWEAIS